MSEIIFDAAAVGEALARMSSAMQGSEVCLIGIHSGGAKVADALQQQLQAGGADVERGNLDISFYRDDFDTIGPNPEVRSTDLPFDVTDKDIWLVDDVLFTGRTIRAALNEIFDYGRPASIRLAVLVDRCGRELPIAADLAGIVHRDTPDCSIKLVANSDATDEWHIVQRRVVA